MGRDKEKRKAYLQANKERINEKRRVLEQTLTARFSYGKRLAASRGIEWTLSFQEYETFLAPLGCFYCNGPMTKTGVGLDRLKNDSGYTLHNVLPCCGKCNRIKSDLLTAKEMVEVAELLKGMRGGKLWK